jgi:hypothetical protein
VRPEECRRGGIRPWPQGLPSSHCARRSAGHAEDVQGTGNGPVCSQRDRFGASAPGCRLTWHFDARSGQPDVCGLGGEVPDDHATCIRTSRQAARPDSRSICLGASPSLASPPASSDPGDRRAEAVTRAGCPARDASRKPQGLPPACVAREASGAGARPRSSPGKDGHRSMGR